MSKITPYHTFITWYAIPESQRDPKSIDDFCTRLSITKADVVEYSQRETFYDDLYKAAQDWGKSKVPELLHLLYKEYKDKKNPSHLKMFKELLELNKENKNIINFNNFNPSDEQYRQIVAREARLLEERSAVTSA